VEIRQLGGTGVRVSALCLGAMNFREDNSEEGVATIRAALDAGVNFIDTANVYSRGQSETVVGRAISGIRDEVVLATKVHGQMSDSGVNDRGNSRRHIKAQCDASLRRLGTDYIDLYQLHRADPTTPIEESLGALDDLIRAGKVHYVGVSTFPAWQTAATLAAAERHHLASAPVCEQPPYNLLDRQIERDILPMARHYNLAVIPWSPLASGILTGKYTSGVPSGARLANHPGLTDKPEFTRAVETTEQLAKLAEQAGLTLVQLALAWLIEQPGVTAPIIGPKDREQLSANLAAADVTLTQDVREAIDGIVPPRGSVFPLN
jgi:aryl-alcohol dehydrogenase-like predicted oxidoreductase